MAKKIAIVGTQGIPAKYGGFETLAENLIRENRSMNIQYTVFCSAKDIKPRLTNYKNALLKYIPLRANGVNSIPYDILSLIRSTWGYDVVLVLGVSGCIFLPFFCLFFRGKLIINIDGLEHRRGKWNRFAKRFLRFSESLAVKFANIIVVDNKGIQDYVKETYKKSSALITYGGNHALREVKEKRQKEILQHYGIEIKEYSLAICRIEPENNCHLILEAFAETGNPIVFVGNWSISKYSCELINKYETYSTIHFINSLYDLDSLYVLRKHCKFYIHGHSAGGTNPSLVEAMFFGNPIFAYDCIYNKETTEYCANYFRSKDDLINILALNYNDLVNNGSSMVKVSNFRYVWEKIIKEYEALY
jgi:glycosyltransferase involved in cell wall biosynthesis